MAACANPHVFVDAALSLDYDAADLSQVTVEWQYDDFYSLLINEDLDIDPGGNGILTPRRGARPQRFRCCLGARLRWQPVSTVGRRPCRVGTAA